MIGFAELGAERFKAILPAGLAALAFLYVMGMDQGMLLSIVQGNSAFDINLIHEFVHDARHAAGFPCH